MIRRLALDDMAVVLPSDSNAHHHHHHHFASNTSLRRSQSQPKFRTQPSYSPRAPIIKSRSNSNVNTLRPSPSSCSLSSSSSSPPTSPIVTHADSSPYNSTPASSLSLDSQEDEIEDQDHILFPSYDDDDHHQGSAAAARYFDPIQDLVPPGSPPTIIIGDSYSVSPISTSISRNISLPNSPDALDHAEDDTAVRSLPSRHVDYLSHNWKEEDIWSSWKLIVSRRHAYTNSARLENASWRTWIKAKNRLKTVSPETLNWLKDCDVTWLYGPLQTGSDRKMQPTSPQSSSSSRRLTQNNSFVLSNNNNNNKKPILKKRSMSEIMLQRSLSASSLLKQAAAAVQAQQQLNGNRPSLGRATSDYVAFPFSSAQRTRPTSNTLPSLSPMSSSGLASPGNERKHIHFNEQVEQCIALEMKGDDDDDGGGDDDDDDDAYAIHDSYDSDSSDDGAIMMKRSLSGRKLPPMQSRKPPPRQTFHAESKTIAMLPSTTLKYREDVPSPPETAMKHSNNGEAYYPATAIMRSPSEETLRPSKPSGRLLLADDDDDDDDDDMNWHPPNALASRKNSVLVTQDRMTSTHRTEEEESSSLPEGAPSSGMRRTASGMFMPYDDSEDDDIVSEGLFGKVVDTVNTARDIAHVIWNVGWRK